MPETSSVVVVESPAKAKTINKYLGQNYRVLASYGHIRDLPAKDGSVDPNADFKMVWEIDPKAQKRMKDIADALKGADRLILATDPDREGEAISWHVLEVLKNKKVLKDKKIERVVFNAITKSAVLDAMIKGGHRVTAMARDPEKAERLTAKGATAVIGELGLPKTYEAAVKAADAVVHCAMETSPRGVEKERQALDVMLSGSETGQQGLQNLRDLFACTNQCGWPEGRVVLDVSIARGLDYYTGTIYETILGDLPGIGSVCSGGRYDNLAELFTSQPLPGVGASLGLDRMLAALEELGRTRKTSTPAPVLITMMDPQRVSDYLLLGRQLRLQGIGVEVYPEAKNMGRQMKYADRRGFRFCVIAGAEEFNAGVWQVKDLVSGTQVSLTTDRIGDHVRQLLQG